MTEHELVTRVAALEVEAEAARGDLMAHRAILTALLQHASDSDLAGATRIKHILDGVNTAFARAGAESSPKSQRVFARASETLAEIVADMGLPAAPSRDGYRT